MKKTALIVCNGEPPTLELLGKLWSEVDLKICADGGANFVSSQGFIPNVIIGDMDSILPETRQKLEASQWVKVEEQETNDGDKALRYCLAQKIKTVHLLGAAGKRSDQFLANIELLYKYVDRLQIFLWTPLERMEVIQGEWQQEVALGTTLSLLPLFGCVRGITTSGLAYPLKNAIMEWGKAPCGVSNEVIAPSVHISMESGALLMVLQMASYS